MVAERGGRRTRERMVGGQGRRVGRGWTRRARVNHGGFKWILQTLSRAGSLALSSTSYPPDDVSSSQGRCGAAPPQRGYNGVRDSERERASVRAAFPRRERGNIRCVLYGRGLQRNFVDCKAHGQRRITSPG